MTLITLSHLQWPLGNASGSDTEADPEEVGRSYPKGVPVKRAESGNLSVLQSLPFAVGHHGKVEVPQVRKELDDVLTVVRYFLYRVPVQRQRLQVLQLPQFGHFD